MMEWNQGKQQLSGSSLLSSIGKAAGSPRLPELLKSKKNLLIYKKSSAADFAECVIFLIRALVCVLGGRVLKGHLAMASFASLVN